MATTVSSRADATNSSGSQVQTLTTGSFTPASDSKLYIAVWCITTGTLDLTISANTGGLTFTRLIQSAAGGDFNAKIALFEAEVSTSPGSMTATIDAGASTETGWPSYCVFDVTSDVGTVELIAGQLVAKAEGDGGGNSETHTTSALPSAATTGNRCILIFGRNNDDDGTYTVPSGWTSIVNHSGQHESMMVCHRSDFTGTSETCTDLGGLVASSGSILFELEEIGGGSPAVPALRGVTRSNLRLG